MIRAAFKKRVYWVMTLLSSWYFLTFLMLTFIFDAILGQANPEQGEQIAKQFYDLIIWRAQLLNGFAGSTVYLLVLALILGAGAIANDNRTNALLVYLSKPCSKFDYIFGKWMGIFVPMSLAFLIPGVGFYLIGILNYREQGFLTQTPWMLLGYLATILTASAFMSSICVGISSLFNQGRLAGATIAGVFFLSKFFSTLVGQILQNSDLRFGASYWLEQLSYLSVDGIMFGLGKIFMNTDGQAMYVINQQTRIVPAPNPALMLGVMIVLSAFFIWIAVARVRAVEVVK
jgi:ABC-2 type transport system permease protein